MRTGVREGARREAMRVKTAVKACGGGGVREGARREAMRGTVSNLLMSKSNFNSFDESPVDRHATSQNGQNPRLILDRNLCCVNALPGRDKIVTGMGEPSCPCGLTTQRCSANESK